MCRLEPSTFSTHKSTPMLLAKPKTFIFVDTETVDEATNANATSFPNFCKIKFSISAYLIFASVGVLYLLYKYCVSRAFLLLIKNFNIVGVIRKPLVKQSVRLALYLRSDGHSCISPWQSVSNFIMNLISALGAYCSSTTSQRLCRDTASKTPNSCHYSKGKTTSFSLLLLPTSNGMGRRRMHAAFMLYKTLGYPELRYSMILNCANVRPIWV